MMIATPQTDPARSLVAGHPRLRLVGAILIDLAALATVVLAAGLVATIWLLVRSDAGANDITPGDGLVALALYAAGLPAWVALEWRALLTSGRTVGRTWMRARSGPPWRAVTRDVWLLLHPASTMLWLWAAATAGLLEAVTAALALAAVAMLVLVLAVASLLRLLVTPDAAPLHELLARLLPGGAD